MKLEELARQSSTAARVSVAHLEAPAIGERAPSRSWLPFVAGVAVTTLVVGGLVVLAQNRDGTEAPAPADSVLPTVVEVPRLGLALDGWTVNFADSIGELNDGVAAPKFGYYGSADSDEPFADGDLVVAAFANAENASVSAESPDGVTVEIRGTTATVSSGRDQGLPGDATTITWTEVDADGASAEIVLLTRTLDIDRLTEIAEALSVDVGTATVIPSDDLGLDRLATASGTPFDAMRGANDGFVIAYESADGSDFAVISTSRGDLAQEATALRWWTDSVEDIAVEGRPGVLATFGEAMPDLGPIVSWSPVDGVVSSVSSFGTDEAIDVVSLAATAFEVDDATWATYLSAAAASGGDADSYDEIFGQGDGAVGDQTHVWTLGLQGDDLCFDIQLGDGSFGSCRERSGIVVPPGLALTIDNGFGSAVGTVLIAADPIVDDVVEVQGAYDITRVEADGISWFVAVGDAAVQPSFEVIVDGAVAVTLEAAVEADGGRPADIEVDLGANSAAIELGVEDIAISLSGETDGGLSWVIGNDETGFCLVTGGVTESAACVAAEDVVVFPPVSTPEGDVSLVVARDMPDCIDSLSIDGPVVDLVGSGGDEQHSYDYWAAFGSSDGWTLRLGSDGADTPVDLPAREGSVAYPAGICEG